MEDKLKKDKIILVKIFQNNNLNKKYKKKHKIKIKKTI